MRPWHPGTSLALAVVLAGLLAPDRAEDLNLDRVAVAHRPPPRPAPKPPTIAVLRGRQPWTGPVIVGIPQGPTVHLSVPDTPGDVWVSGCGFAAALAPGSEADLRVDRLPCTLEPSVVGGSLSAKGKPVVLDVGHTSADLEVPAWTPGGIGVSFEVDRVIGRVLSGGPADLAGLRVKDQIVAVDGASLEGVSSDDTPERIIGPVGEDVTLTIARGSERFDVTIQRGLIVFPDERR